MQMTPIFALPERLTRAIERAMAVDREKEIGRVLTVAARSLEKIAVRQNQADDYQPQRVAQANGPTLTFHGKLLAEYSTARDGHDRWQTGEIWETRGGALVAVLAGCSNIESEIDLAAATVVPPSEDEQARHIAVMDGLKWTDRARSMARALAWDLEREVA